MAAYLASMTKAGAKLETEAASGSGSEAFESSVRRSDPSADTGWNVPLDGARVHPCSLQFRAPRGGGLDAPRGVGRGWRGFPCWAISLRAAGCIRRTKVAHRQ